MGYDYQRKMGRDLDTLLHNIESEAHKAGELHRSLDALHKTWDSEMARGKFEDAHRAYQKLDAALKTYNKALVTAMGDLEAYEEETARHDEPEYPEKF